MESTLLDKYTNPGQVIAWTFIGICCGLLAHVSLGLGLVLMVLATLCLFGKFYEYREAYNNGYN